MDTIAELPDVTRLESGKVRDRYLVRAPDAEPGSASHPTDAEPGSASRPPDDLLLLVASDRISAYDCVLPTPIPDKGAVLTGLSDFWFDLLHVAHHRVTSDVDAFPPALQAAADRLRGRAMLCRRAEPLPVECVVRGYLAGSAWVEYSATGAVSGIRLPQDLVEADRLPVPVFTPATKAVGGHDENVTFAELTGTVGAELAAWLRDTSLRLYATAAAHALERGIILADTKFEFGLIGGRPVLIDEVCTPDSSRFWPADRYRPGGVQPSYDKQYVRDWLDTAGWDRRPPAPELPPEVVEQTRARYVQAYETLTGRAFADRTRKA